MQDKEASRKLHIALKAVAPDGGDYELGQHNFWTTLNDGRQNGQTLADLLAGDGAAHYVVDKAIQHALLTASPTFDFERYWAAYDLFWETTTDDPEAGKQSRKFTVPKWMTDFRSSARSRLNLN